MTRHSWTTQTLLRRWAGALAVIALLAACGPSPTRLGMVKDPESGLMLGSRISNNPTLDSAFYADKRVKIKIRNASGDPAFDIRSFRSQIESAFVGNGFEPTDGDRFALLVDINVVYSGHIQENASTQLALLGLAAGGIAGERSEADAGLAIGLVSGATLGSVVGSFITEDTYIIAASTKFVVTNLEAPKSKKTISFSRSTRIEDVDDEDDGKRLKPIASTNTNISVFAGGTNTPQSRITEMVRARLAYIVSNLV